MSSAPLTAQLAFFLWDTKGWRGPYCSPVRSNAPQKCNPLWDTPALPLDDLLLSLSGFIKTFNHLFSICELLAHTLKVAHICPFCTSLLPGKKLLYHTATLVYILSQFFLLLLSLLTRKMILCNACCTFYMRAFKLFLTRMHSTL